MPADRDSILGTDDTDVGLLIGLLPIAAMLGVLGYFIFERPQPPPPPSAFSGCFAAIGAAPIRLDGAKIRFSQADMKPVEYYFALEKYGQLALSTRPAIQLIRNPTGDLQFRLGESGYLNDIRLAHVIDGQAYGVFAPEAADYIEVTANDGSLWAFRPADPRACNSTTK